MKTVLALLTVFLSLAFASARYQLGVGIADMTGPIVQITFMGYAKLDQKGTGLHLRQFSRAFIMIDENDNRLVFVTADIGMMGELLRDCVIQNIQKKFGKIYNADNVILSGTHTHSGPGGFLGDLLFDLPSLGFSKQTFNAYCSGIARSIGRAHYNIKPGRIFFSQGRVDDANINRSPTAYVQNPKAERAMYDGDTDTIMFQLKLVGENMEPMGVINWFPVHATSMNNTNTLVSSDNQGYAAILMEQAHNVGRPIGKGPFVAGFASSNLGDVSPNTKGPRCEKTGKDCEIHTSKCPVSWDQCVSPGPGEDMYDSTRIIAWKLFETAKKLYHQDDGKEVKGGIKSIHQFKDMPNSKEEIVRDDGTVETVTGCIQAMGASFAAGTTDGPGAFGFEQGTTTPNPFWNIIRDFLGRPSKEVQSCHAPKPILLCTGCMNFPFEFQPKIVSTQLAIIGNIVIVAVPGEFTTMSGRRLKYAVREALQGAVEDSTVIIAGLSNTYADYITTFEEYQVQRYEGASTIYGPHTLTLYIAQYERLAKALIEGVDLERGPLPPENLNDFLTLITPVVFDTPYEGKPYGQPTVHPKSQAYSPGDTVVVKFVSGNPRSCLKHDETFCTVERHERDDIWTVVYTDGNWETMVIWEPKSTILGTSEMAIKWTVPEDAMPGTYRIKHFGCYKYVFGGVYDYEGTSKNFTVVNDGYKS